jgi:hypothetical protein
VLFYTEVIGFLIVIVGFSTWIFVKALRQALNPKDAFKVDPLPQDPIESNEQEEPATDKP